MVHIDGQRWVVGGGGATNSETQYGGSYGGPVRALVLSAADVADGNTSVLYSLTHDVFAQGRLGPSDLGRELMSLELSQLHAAARNAHDLGWSRGWSSVVQPLLSSRHYALLNERLLAITLPHAPRYAPRGPEMIRLALPPSAFSCEAALAQPRPGRALRPRQEARSD